MKTRIDVIKLLLPCQPGFQFLFLRRDIRGCGKFGGQPKFSIAGRIIPPGLTFGIAPYFLSAVRIAETEKSITGPKSKLSRMLPIW